MLKRCFFDAQNIHVFLVTTKAKEPEEFIVFPNELQEKQTINLICSADVGSPKGNIKI